MSDEDDALMRGRHDAIHAAREWFAGNGFDIDGDDAVAASGYGEGGIVIPIKPLVQAVIESAVRSVGRGSALTIDRAKVAIKENQGRAPYLSEWVHVKSGGRYVVKAHVLIEATLEPAVIYYGRHADPLLTWCRPASEFFDGRFERAER